MTTLLLLLRFFLSGVFLLAGLLKVADPKGSRESLAGFGMPNTLAGFGAVLLPLAEIGVGVCLLPASLAWCGSAGALALAALSSCALRRSVRVISWNSS